MSLYHRRIVCFCYFDAFFILETAFGALTTTFFFAVLMHRVQTRRFFPSIHLCWRFTYCRRSTFML